MKPFPFQDHFSQRPSSPPWLKCYIISEIPENLFFSFSARGTMPPKSKVHDVLANFRIKQAQNVKIQADATKEREEKLKKIQSGGEP